MNLALIKEKSFWEGPFTISLVFVVGITAIMTLTPHWQWENPRFDSVVDGMVAVVTLTSSLLLLLGGVLQNENSDESLAYVFLTSGIIRFLSSSTENDNISIWTHRFCSVTLGIGLLINYLPLTRRGGKRFAKKIQIFLLTVTLALSAGLYLIPNLLPAALSPEGFTLPLETLSIFATLLFVASAIFQARQYNPRELHSFSFFVTTLVLGFVALVYPFTTIWHSRWWMIQLSEILATLFLSLSLFVTHNRRLSKNRCELKEAVSQLKRANSELENFSSVAAHDLAEPLRTIASYCQLLERNYGEKLDAQGKQFLHFAVDGSKRMHILIKELLTYSRIGKTEAPLIETDCQTLVNDTLFNLEVAIKEKGAEIKAENLPTVQANPVLLGELFQNLISNALKYQKVGSLPKIAISADKKEREWVFSIRDNGIGIKSEYLEQIFEMFKRLHSKGEYAGTGIGLATCKKIVTLHGGNIWVQSKIGEGSTFYFSLPASAA